ncbi:MAG: hypothetical protein E6J40_07175 [Chloroflexi bacterium]|nr:MAG: hypothetical protein E6J40_07175 [Chloroflexota bacterium]
MTRASRIVCVVLVAAGALLPITASAIPIPSPSLASILLPPPSGYAELASAPFHGQFTSSAYAASWGKQSVEAETALNEAGFVDAYATFWVDQLAKRALIEYVVAFEGGQGARSWLSFAETGSKADPTYQHANTMSGIDPYYGQHNVYPSHAILDEFAFVKGNDYFVVGFESLQNDVLNLAMTRAKNQYSAAPGSTIPIAQWPENANAASSQSPAFAFGGLVADALVVVLVAGLIGAVAALVIRRRRRSAVPAGESWTAVQLSPDGHFWWDGQGWRDTAVEAPPFAQRTSDALYWWDGSKWRPVPLEPVRVR